MKAGKKPKPEKPITGYLVGEVVVDHGSMGEVLVQYQVPIVSFIGADGIRDFRFVTAKKS